MWNELESENHIKLRAFLRKKVPGQYWELAFCSSSSPNLLYPAATNSEQKYPSFFLAVLSSTERVVDEFRLNILTIFSRYSAPEVSYQTFQNQLALRYDTMIKS